MVRECHVLQGPGFCWLSLSSDIALVVALTVGEDAPGHRHSIDAILRHVEVPALDWHCEGQAYFSVGLVDKALLELDEGEDVVAIYVGGIIWRNSAPPSVILQSSLMARERIDDLPRGELAVSDVAIECQPLRSIREEQERL